MNRLENIADNVLGRTIMDLFKRRMRSPSSNSRISENLEIATDKCEDVANVLAYSHQTYLNTMDRVIILGFLLALLFNYRRSE